MIPAPYIHAMIIHFPIALLIVGLLTEVLGLISNNQFFKNASFYLLILGTLGVVAAFLSGDYASDGMKDVLLQKPIGMHEESALVTMWLAIITAVYSSVIYILNYQMRWVKFTRLLLFALLVGFIARTGYLGGELVFKHGAGLELVVPDFETQSN